MPFIVLSFSTNMTTYDVFRRYLWTIVTWTINCSSLFNKTQQLITGRRFQDLKHYFNEIPCIFINKTYQLVLQADVFKSAKSNVVDYNSQRTSTISHSILRELDAPVSKISMDSPGDQAKAFSFGFLQVMFRWLGINDTSSKIFIWLIRTSKFNFFLYKWSIFIAVL